ncbi:MAG: extensin family protein, partial [Methylacidiphilales bacterium]|nr:extensin family protein [Candidatus Methylacidiphilales bacterium]
MSRVVIRIGAVAVAASVLSNCGLRMFEQREPWRTEAEIACLNHGLVTPSEHLKLGSEIDGNGACGMTRPFKVSAFADGFVAVKPHATLACPIIPQLQVWITESIQPAAMRWFGRPVVEIRQMSSYSCRNQNGASTGKISEHAFGNALDIGAFKLADDHVISVRDHWTRGTPEEKGFLREISGAACKRFTTVLAPGSNIYHYDHIHLDLAQRKSRDICNPSMLPTGPSPSDLIVRKSFDGPAPGFGNSDKMPTSSIRAGMPRPPSR